ncbi:hypothetical protein HDU67_006911 [Dinochytrium kinnereticum]|nr:hypothetical protein HDU67_006911 [Dinochytrium kinnereticum]
MQNQYLILRHGESIPNVGKLIISSPSAGTLKENGLTDTGRLQAENAGRGLVSMLMGMAVDSVVVKIISSDFSRAIETATIVSQIIHDACLGSLVCLHPVVVDERLRERFFGEFEGGSSLEYETAWRDDSLLGHDRLETFEKIGPRGVESSYAVAERVMQLLCDLEAVKASTLTVVLLVSHGDTLQITQTLFEVIPPHLHRQLPHLGTAELRKLVAKTPISFPG